MSGKKATRSTMEDVARASGHSLSTVDRVLNGRRNVRASTAREILEAAEELNYYASGVIRERIRAVKSPQTLGFLLQRPDAAFYKDLAESLVHATETCPGIRGKAVVEYLSSQAPERVATHIVALGAKVDALAVVAADHLLITEAVEQLHRRGVPVFALISDLTAPKRAGFAGIDNRRLGRAAAWFIAELSHRPGKVVMYVGSPRFQCQEVSEISFRSYLREYAPNFELLESITTLESEDYGEERTHDLLRRHPDLCGFYMGGSGIEGVLRALRAYKPVQRIVGVGNEITSVTRSGLVSGHFHVLLAHPLPLLCQDLIGAMADALTQRDGVFRQILVPMEIHVPQSI